MWEGTFWGSSPMPHSKQDQPLKLISILQGDVPLNSETLQGQWCQSLSGPLCQCSIILIREKSFCVSSWNFPWYNLWLLAFVLSLQTLRRVWLCSCSNPAPSTSLYVPCPPAPTVIVALHWTDSSLPISFLYWRLKTGHIIPDVASWGLSRGEQPLSLVWELTYLMLSHIMGTGTSTLSSSMYCLEFTSIDISFLIMLL